MSEHQDGPGAQPAADGEHGEARAPRVGDYELLERLSARAWKGRLPAPSAAQQTGGRSDSAVLRLLPLPQDPKFIERLKKDCEAASRLNHPGAARVLGFGRAEGELARELGLENRAGGQIRPSDADARGPKDPNAGAGLWFIAEEFVEGESLESALSRLGALAEPNAIALATQAAGALDCAYGLGLVHGGIRPSSIIVTPEGRVVLVGFGAAAASEQVAGAGPSTDTTLGAGAPADIRGDIFSLGALLYRAVTARAGPARQVRAGELAWPAEVRGGVSERLSLVIAKAMALDPSERYQTPRELLLDLGIVAQGQPPVIASKRPASSAIAAGPGAGSELPGAERGAPAAALRRYLPAMAAAAGLAVAAALVALVGFRRGGPEPPAQAGVQGESGGAPGIAATSREATGKSAADAKAPPARRSSAEPEEAPARAATTGAAGRRPEGSGRREAALAALEGALSRARSAASSGDYDRALAALDELPAELASEIEEERRSAAAGLLAQARETLASALAQADSTLSSGDLALARAALEAAEAFACERARTELAPRIEHLRRRIAAAEEAARTKEIAKTEASLRAFGAEFVSLAAKGELAAAKALVERAESALARAAARVVAALEARTACMRRAADGLVGSQVALRAKSGPKRGEIVSVGPDGLTLATKVIINGEVRGETKSLLAWAELAPEEEDRLAESWGSGGPDHELARALLALGRGDAASAEKALGAAGAHPLVPFVREALDRSKSEAAEAAAAAAWSEIEKALASGKPSASDGRALLERISAFEKEHAGTRFFASLGAKLAAARERSQAAASGGSPPKGPPLRGLRLWLRADAGVTLDGELVSQWADESRLRLRAVQTERPRRPRFVPDGLAGRPAIRFDGRDDQLVLSDCPASGDFTLAFVAATSHRHELDRESASGRAGAEGQRYVFGATNGGGSGVSMGVNGISVYEREADSVPALAVYHGSVGPGPAVVVVQYAAKRPSVFLNGSLARKGLESPRPTVKAPREIGSGAGGAFAGELGEVLVYGSALPEAERSAVESYLAWKYLGKSIDELSRAPAPREGTRSALPDGGGPVFVEESGRCVIEAEHFSASTKRGDSLEWSLATSQSGYAGEGYMVAAADTTPARHAGHARPASWETGCELTFLVSIQTAGRYYVALRCRGPTAYSDSVFVGLDGNDKSAALGYFTQASRGWIWLRGLAPLGELQKGVHAIQVRRREALFELDRLMLSTDESTLPANRSTEIGPPESRQRAVEKAAGSSPPRGPTSLALLPEPPPARAGLESGEWTGVDWANPVTVSLREAGAPGGRGALKMTVAAGGAKDKAAVVRRERLELGGKTLLRFGARNLEGEPVEIALALATPAGYFESLPVALPSGRRVGMALDLRARDFKCEATKWEFASALAGAEELRELYVLIYSGPRAATVELDSIAFE